MEPQNCKASKYSVVDPNGGLQGARVYAQDSVLYLLHNLFLFIHQFLLLLLYMYIFFTWGIFLTWNWNVD